MPSIFFQANGHEKRPDGALKIDDFFWTIRKKPEPTSDSTKTKRLVLERFWPVRSEGESQGRPCEVSTLPLVSELTVTALEPAKGESPRQSKGNGEVP